jgi:hypothetical protein
MRATTSTTIGLGPHQTTKGETTGRRRKANGIMLAAVTCATAFACAPQLKGQEATWSKYNYGFQVGMLMPTGEKLKDVAGTGFGAAGYLEKIWSVGWGIRGRLEYTYFGEKDQGFEVKTNTTQTGGMLDLIYYSRSSLFYPFVGIGVFSRSGQQRIGVDKEHIDMPSSTAVSLGAGWNFSNNLGLEIKYSVTESSWAQVSILSRF